MLASILSMTANPEAEQTRNSSENPTTYLENVS
jgi:hypothetical protein